MALFLRSTVLGALCVSLAHGQLAVSLNENNHFVVNHSNAALSSIIFSSKSNSLTPASSSAPFQALNRNDTGVVWFSNLDSLTFDGAVTLSAGWNPDGQQDIKVDYGHLGRSVGVDYNRCLGDCPRPQLGVTLNEENRFVLEGKNHTLRALEFLSQGSLTTATDTGPFQSLHDNTAQRISFQSPTGVTIDGSVTLSAGWDPQGTLGDVQYRYSEASGVDSAVFHIPNEEFPQGRHLDATINDQHQIVLRGSGHQVNALQFSSRSGALIPGNSPEPFANFAENSSQLISLRQIEGHLQLDGEVTLDAAWDPRGAQDVRFAYQGAEGTADGAYFLSRGNYPSASGRPKVWLSLDEDYQLLLHGNGIRLAGIELRSADGALVPGATATPFQFSLSTQPTNVTLGSLTNTPAVDGSIKLPVSWNPLLGSRDLVAQYGIDSTGVATAIRVFSSDLALCPGCEVPRVALQPGGQVSLSGFEVELTEVHVTSASGSLLALEEPDPLFSLDNDTQEAVRLAIPAGLNALEATALPIAWSTIGVQDVFVSFTTVDGDVIGPFAVPAEAYRQAVPEPSTGLLLVAAIGGCIPRRRRR